MSLTSTSKEFLNNQAENTNVLRKKIECYQKIIELDFDDADAFLKLGNIYSPFDENKSKRYWEMSVHRYTKKIESFKGDASTYLKKSRNTESQKIELKDMFVEIGQIFYKLGQVYAHLEKYSQAHDLFQKAFEMNPEKIDCLYAIGLVLWLDEKLDESKKYILKFLEQESTYYAHYFLGLIYASENSVLESLKEFWMCIDDSQSDSNSDHYRACAYNCLGNTRLAERYFKRSILRDPENVESLYSLIQHYEENGEGKKGYEYYERIKTIKKSLKDQNEVFS